MNKTPRTPKIPKDPQIQSADAGGWDKHDYALLGLAVATATLADLALVKAPASTRFLGRLHPGSPVTGWLRTRSAEWHQCWGKPLERWAEVPFDFAHHQAVPGLRPKLHRLMSPGHDPLIGLAVGLRDLLRGEATLVDKFGQTHVLPGIAEPMRLDAAVVCQLAHLLSDVFTRAGLPAPGFSALLGITARSPFQLRPDGDAVNWNDVARWMYAQGFDLRHFLTQGLTVAAVELVVRGGWLLARYGREVTERDRRRLEDLRLVAHSLVTGGSLLKVALTKNPLYLNIAQVYAVAGMLLGRAAPHARRAAQALADRFVKEGTARQAIKIFRRVA